MESAYKQFYAGMARILAAHEADLHARGAFEMQAESNFVGYLRVEPDGRISNEIVCWGVSHGKLYGETVEAVTADALRIYG